MMVFLGLYRLFYFGLIFKNSGITSIMTSRSKQVSRSVHPGGNNVNRDGVVSYARMTTNIMFLTKNQQQKVHIIGYPIDWAIINEIKYRNPWENVFTKNDSVSSKVDSFENFIRMNIILCIKLSKYFSFIAIKYFFKLVLYFDMKWLKVWHFAPEHEILS